MDEEWRPREGKCLSPGHTAINGQSQRLNSSPGPAHHKSDELGLGERCGCLGRGQSWLLMLAGKIHCQGFRTAGGKWASGWDCGSWGKSQEQPEKRSFTLASSRTHRRSSMGSTRDCWDHEEQMGVWSGGYWNYLKGPDPNCLWPLVFMVVANAITSGWSFPWRLGCPVDSRGLSSS